MKIVTGYRGEAHITSDDEQAYNSGVWGFTGLGYLDHVVILGVGRGLRAEKTGWTQVTVECGDAVSQGVHFRIPYGETEVLDFTLPGSGYYRKDLVAFHYTKTLGDDQESVELAVIEGTPATTMEAAACPTVTTGNIYQGARDVYIPFLRVELNHAYIEHAYQLENVQTCGGFRSLENTQAYDAGRIDDAEDAISAITENIIKVTSALGLLWQAQAAVPAGGTAVIDMGPASTATYTACLVSATYNSGSPTYDYIGLLFLNRSAGTTHVLDIAKGNSANVVFTAAADGKITVTNNINIYCRACAVQIYG